MSKPDLWQLQDRLDEIGTDLGNCREALFAAAAPEPPMAQSKGILWLVEKEVRRCEQAVEAVAAELRVASQD